MSRVIVDTSIFIDHLRGHGEAARFLASAGETHELWSVTVVRTEVLAGMRRGEEAATFELLQIIRWHDITTSIADRAGELARRYLRSHPGLDTIDYLIGAAVEELAGVLATRNVKHFPMFRGLKPPY